MVELADRSLLYKADAKNFTYNRISISYLVTHPSL